MADQRQAGKRGLLPQRQGSERFAIKWAHEYLAAPLPAPRYPIDETAGVPPGPMWDNDRYGDCGEAAILYIDEATAVLAGQPAPTFDPFRAKREYFEYQAEQAGIAWRPPPAGDFTPPAGLDLGVVLADFLLWRFRKGYIKAFAPVPHTDRVTCDTFLQEFKALYCGGSLYDNSEAQFNAGQTWDPAGQAPDPNLGHCIDKVASDGAAVEKWRSWAQYQRATLAWGQGFLGEAWVVVTTEEQLAKFGPQLLADILAIPGGQGGRPLPPPAPPPAPGPAPAPRCVVDGPLVLAGISLVSADQWRLVASRVAPFLPRRSMATAWSWLQAAAVKVARAFLLAFLPPVVAAGAGMFSLPTLKVAAVAGLVAAAMALDALIGNAANPGSVGTLHALGAIRTRRWQAKAWAYYQAVPDQ